MSIALVTLGSYLFTMTVIRSKEGHKDAMAFAVAAWLVGSIAPLMNFEKYTDVLLSSASLAGLAFLGVVFGRWLGNR
jgi:hypothetical protein